MAEYKVLSKMNQINELQNLLIQNRKCALDVETTSLDVHSCTLLLIQLCAGDEILLIDAREFSPHELKYIVALLKDSNVLFIGHNIKFDIKVLYALTGELLLNVYDTMIGEILTYNGNGNQYPSLEDVVEKYCGVKLDKETRKSFIDFNGASLTNNQLIYGALDVKFLDAVRNEQLRILKSQNQLETMSLEMSIVPVIADMEVTGVKIDNDSWRANVKLYAEHAENQKKELYDYAYDRIDKSSFKNILEFAEFMQMKEQIKRKRDRVLLETISIEFAERFFYENFNWDSPAQVKKMFEICGLKLDSTAEKVIKDYAGEYPLVNLILNYRESAKKLSTYGESFLQNSVHPKTGRVHSEFNQLGTATGRFSSDSPNLQNIPREKIYRKSFVADKGYKIITADYSQAELRLLADLCNDKEMCHAFLTGEDLHAKSGAVIYQVPIEKVTKEQRQTGKTFNFGLVYGISEYGLYRNFGIPLEEGKVYLERYFGLYKTLKSFLDLAGEKVWEMKFSVTPLGRRRFFENKILFKEPKEYRRYQGRVKREGVNHIIQGGISDVVKIAMRDIYFDNPYGNNLKILMQVHDEIVFLAKEEIADEAKDWIKQKMIDAAKNFITKIPVDVDAHVEDTWTK